MKRLWLHMRSLWPRFTLVPTLPFLVYGGVMIAIGDVRWDHVVMMIFPVFIAYYSPRTKRLFTGAYAIMLTSLLYDAMRYFRNVGVSPERVHVCDLRNLELSLFGLTSLGQRITIQDWFLTHHATWLDLYSAVPYGSYIFAELGCAIVLWQRDTRAVQRFAWAFFVMNIAAFVTYHLYPAAPPWYFHAHGCVVDMAVNPMPGPRLEHVDEVLGIGYFHGLYARSSDVFGAMPSLHVAYPMLILLEGWALFHRFGKAFAIVFFVSMGFAAVYLDHHWVVDLVVGMIYCAASWALVRWLAGRAATSEPKLAQAAEGST